jgi:uncharacterized protein YegL
MQRIQTANPVHIVMIADNSGSILHEAHYYSEALQEWIMGLQAFTRGTKDYFYISYLLMGSKVDVLCEFTSVNEIDAGSVLVNGRGGTTNMDGSLTLAAQLVQKHHRPHHCDPAVFMYTDGKPDRAHKTEDAARSLLGLSLPGGQQVQLIPIGVGEAIDRAYLSRLPRDPRFAKFAPNSEELSRLLPAVGTPTAGVVTEGGIWDNIVAIDDF